MTEVTPPFPLGPYQLLEVVGRGGMAVIYRATQAILERQVAVKVLSSHLTHDPNFVERFRREALAAAKLNHPNIVTIYDVGQQAGTHYIAMEFVEGESLDKIIERGPLPLPRALALLEQVASALDYAHARGIVHRDIKPANVIVEPNEQVTLTDFGIAKAASEGAGLTQTGTMIGTPQYMAPEQIQGLPADHRLDIYALGIMAYEMLAGKAPFQGDTAAVLFAHVSTPPPALRQWNSTLPAHVEAAIQRALAKQPAERFDRASDFVAALAGHALIATTQVAPQPARPPASEAATRQIDAVAEPPVTERVERRPLVLPPEPVKRRGPGIGLLLGGMLLLLVAGAGLFALANAVGGSLFSPAIPTVDPEARQRTEAAVLARIQRHPNTGEAVFSYRTDAPPTIDGNLAEWEREHFYAITTPVFQVANVSSPADSSGEFATRWDESHLYLAVRVRDETLVQMESGVQIFRGDSIELLFDTALAEDFASEQLSADDFQIGVMAGTPFERAPEVYRWFPKAREGTLSTARVAAQATAEGYEVEIRLPWAEAGIQPLLEQGYGFNVALNDNDTPGSAAQESMVSLSPARRLADPRTWGTLILLSK